MPVRPQAAARLGDISLSGTKAGKYMEKSFPSLPSLGLDGSRTKFTAVAPREKRGKDEDDVISGAKQGSFPARSSLSSSSFPKDVIFKFILTSD